MPVCSDCQFDVPRADYSPSQLKKKPDERRCKACVVMSQPLAEGDIYKLTDDEFRRQTKKIGLTLANFCEYYDRGNERAILHRAAENINSWCDQDEIDAFLSDEDEIDKLCTMTVHCFNRLSHCLGDLGEAVSETKVICNANTCSDYPVSDFDNSEDSDNEGLDGVVLDDEGPDNIGSDDKAPQEEVPDDQVADDEISEGEGSYDEHDTGFGLHRTILYLSLSCSLLLQPGSDKLLMRMVVDDLTKHVLGPCYSIIAHCTIRCQKLTQLASGLVALIVAKMPMANAAWPDPPDKETLGMHIVATLVDHLNYLCLWIQLGSPRLEKTLYHCTGNILVALPTLYHVVTWKNFRTVQRSALNTLVKLVTRWLSALRHFRMHKVFIDASAVQHHHSLGYVREIFVRTGDTEPWRQALLDKHPMSFAIVGLVEVLGWWNCKGMPLGEYDVVGLDDKALTFLSFMNGYLFELEEIVKESPSLSYIMPIAKALAENQTPRKPMGAESLLFGPLVDSNRRCELASCRKTAEEAGVRDLQRCQGCDGLAQYCCIEHYREDWKQSHSKYCKIYNKQRRHPCAGRQVG